MGSVVRQAGPHRVRVSKGPEEDHKLSRNEFALVFPPVFFFFSFFFSGCNVVRISFVFFLFKNQTGGWNEVVRL